MHRTRTVALLLLIALGLTPGWARGPVVGDYGDAPDGGPAYEGVTGRFPTRFATTNSRVGLPGAVTTITDRSWLGFSDSRTSREAGAADPSDPDGTPNLPGSKGSDGDAFDDGLTAVFITEPIFVPINESTATPMIDLSGVVVVSVAAGAPDTRRYLNVLVDVNHDGEWRNRRDVREWTTENDEITVMPGREEKFMIDLGRHAEAADTWVRILLSTSQINEDMVAALGGWDGSGMFGEGEVEDHLILSRDFVELPPDDPGPGPDGSACVFRVRCETDPLVLPHGTTGDLVIAVDVFDPLGEGCSVELISFKEDTIGPFFGVGVQNGSAGMFPTPQQVVQDAPIPTPLGTGNTVRFHFPVGGAGDPPPRIQSFAIRARIGGFVGSRKIYGASKTCGVIIFHDWPTHGQVRRNFVPGEDNPINAGAVNFFGSLTNTLDESLEIARVNDLLPTLPEGTRSVLPRYWVLNHFRGSPHVTTEVHNIFFQWDSLFGPSGLSDDTKLRAAYWHPGNFGDVNGFVIPSNQQSAVGIGGTDVTTPPGFSVWIVGEDLNENGILDFEEVGSEVARDTLLGLLEGILLTDLDANDNGRLDIGDVITFVNQGRR